LPESARLINEWWGYDENQEFGVVINGGSYDYPRAEDYYGGVPETETVP
jgi:hypothetical protein